MAKRRRWRRDEAGLDSESMICWGRGCPQRRPTEVDLREERRTERL